MPPGPAAQPPRAAGPLDVLAEKDEQVLFFLVGEASPVEAGVRASVLPGEGVGQVTAFVDGGVEKVVVPACGDRQERV